MLTAITPTAPVAPWLGNKRNLARRICAIIDATPCLTYAEPFVGMGGIVLRRTARPRAEVINDRGRDIANLLRIPTREPSLTFRRCRKPPAAHNPINAR